MTLFDYLLAAPWWHWPFMLVFLALIAQWRPIHLRKTTETHDHKHVHTEKEVK